MAERVYVWRYLDKPRPIVAASQEAALAQFLRNCGPDVKALPSGAEYLGSHSRRAYRAAWAAWSNAGKPQDMGAFRNG